MVVTAGGGGATVNGGRAPSVLTRRQHARNRREARATYVQQRRAVTAIDVCVCLSVLVRLCVCACVCVCVCACVMCTPPATCAHACKLTQSAMSERSDTHARAAPKPGMTEP